MANFQYLLKIVLNPKPERKKYVPCQERVYQMLPRSWESLKRSSKRPPNDMWISHGSVIFFTLNELRWNRWNRWHRCWHLQVMGPKSLLAARVWTRLHFCLAKSQFTLDGIGALGKDAYWYIGSSIMWNPIWAIFNIRCGWTDYN